MSAGTLSGLLTVPDGTTAPLIKRADQVDQRFIVEPGTCAIADISLTAAGTLSSSADSVGEVRTVLGVRCLGRRYDARSTRVGSGFAVSLIGYAGPGFTIGAPRYRDRDSAIGVTISRSAMVTIQSDAARRAVPSSMSAPCVQRHASRRRGLRP
jgi:hypothetical protein